MLRALGPERLQFTIAPIVVNNQPQDLYPKRLKAIRNEGHDTTDSGALAVCGGNDKENTPSFAGHFDDV